MTRRRSTSRDGKDGNNVISKVGDFQKILADTRQSKLKRRDALLFIIHFVGDMHQPLHCIDRNDRGGNKIEISINGRHQREGNLHSFWDTTLVELAMDGLEIPDFSLRLDAQISSANKKEWGQGARSTGRTKATASPLPRATLCVGKYCRRKVW